MKKIPPSQGKIYPLFSIVLLGLLSVPMGFYGMYLYIAPSLPNMSSLQKAPLEQPLQIYSQDNQLIAEFGEKMSMPVQYKDIPPNFIHAFLAAEDSSFFEHSGVSFKGLGRAISESVSGGNQTGGSTITMQVAKNYYLSPERTFRRKLTEIFLARKIEQNLSKEDILTLYVNKIFLGKNAYGIQAAARIYYNKTLPQMTLAEMAMIAGLPKAPSKYNPVVNPERALERRNWILGRMLQLGYINQQQYQTAIAEPIQLHLYEHRVINKFPYVAELVRSELVSQFGEGVVNSGIKVYTTIDSQRQALAEKAVQDGLEAYDRRHGWRGAEAHNKPLDQFVPFANMYPAKVTKVTSNSFFAQMKDGSSVTIPWSGMSWVTLYQNANNPGPYASRPSQIVKVDDIVRLRQNDNKTWSLVQVPRVEGQLIALNPNSGAVIAVVGGYNYFHSTFNRATQGYRQPGSTIKPFIYSLALEQGMTPFTMVDDAPITIGKWSPKNSDNRYLGMIPLRRALYLSRNTVSVRLIQSNGIERTRQFLMDIGLQDDHIPHNATIALGTPQVLPIQMATGYAAIANGGYRVQPYFIDHINDGYGNRLYTANPAYACIRCIDGTNQNKTATLPSATPDQQQPASDAASAAQATNQPDYARLNSTQNYKILGKYRQAEQIMKSSSAVDMAGILRDVIEHGTGRAALKIGRSDLSGKTGTTNNAKDAWFAGFNGSLVAVSWVGFDIPSTLGRREYGGVAALPIWIDFMQGALQGKPLSWVTAPNDDTTHTDLSNNKNRDALEDRRQKREVPQTAHSISKPAPIAPQKSAVEQRKEDFSDLPGEEILIPNDNTPPKMKKAPAPMESTTAE